MTSEIGLCHQDYINIAKSYFYERQDSPVAYAEFFWHTGTHLKPTEARCHGWCSALKFSKFVSTDTLKMRFADLIVLRFLCKTFSKLPKLSL